jgi:indole-3-acetate monooxygenase
LGPGAAQFRRFACRRWSGAGCNCGKQPPAAAVNFDHLASQKPPSSPQSAVFFSLLEVARAFRPRIIAERDHIEAARRIPEDIAQDLAGAGFFHISLPEAYGGLDLTPMQAMEIFEELARADASVAWCVWNSNTYWTIAQLSPEAARTIHADPDAVTANSTRSSGQAQVVDGGYRVRMRAQRLAGSSVHRP